MKTLKHFVLILFTLSVASFALFAKNDDYISKVVNISQFDAVELSSGFHVTFEKSDTYSLQITVPAKFADDVIAKVKNHTLILKINPKVWRIIKSEYQFTASITAPAFNDLDIRGAVVINFVGDFETDKGNIEFSGASHISGLNLKAKELKVDISGACHFEKSDLISDKLSMDVSGASKCNINIISDESNIDISGASKSTFRIFADRLMIDASGASKCVLNSLKEDTGTRLSLDLSGASRVDAEELKYDIVYADLSGASHAKVSPIKKLSIESSGASSLQYVKAPNLDMEIDISGSSSVKHL